MASQALIACTRSGIANDLKASRRHGGKKSSSTNRAEKLDDS
jgi:hypothetical protein